MKQIILVLLAGAALIAAALPTRADPRSFSVLTYHGVAVRSGHFIVPGLTQERARSIHLDTAFRAKLSGRVRIAMLDLAGRSLPPTGCHRCCAASLRP